MEYCAVEYERPTYFQLILNTSRIANTYANNLYPPQSATIMETELTPTRKRKTQHNKVY